MADLAPTLAQYLGYDFTTPDGAPLHEAVTPGGEPPKLIVVVVWDAGGRNVMDHYDDAWPNVSRLIPQGAWFDHATVGSSPSVTPAVHSTLGTGVFPDRHGILDLRIRQGETLVGPILSGPRYLRVPTLADLYDRDNGNQPLVGFVASEPTLGMIGHGSFLDGGDRDLALGQREGEWGLTPENIKYFTFRDYVNDLPGLDEAIRELDGRDGQLDGLWLGEDVFSDPYYILKTPAYAEYQTGVLREVILREGFGSDDVPDLLFTNYKQIDQVGHQWSWPSPQMDAVIGSSDEAIGDLVKILDQEVGRDQWVLALTADHGATPTSEYSGGFRIDQQTLTEAVNEAFDRDGDDVKVVQSFRVTQMWMNMAELKENGATLEDVSRFLMRYTEGDNDPSATDSPGERVLQAAFPSYVLKNLPCDPRDGPA
jgi:predicted AlkP superfamily pyrophosphatase or phosphodiesterase